MIFKKFRTIYQAYKNVEAYEELLNAKERLASTEDMIFNGERKITDLNKQYTANKERATLACLTPVEVRNLQNEQINHIAAQMIEDFNEKLNESTKLGKDHLKFTIYNPQQPDIKALKFIANKLKNEGFKINLGDIEYPPGMYMGRHPWEMSMYVEAPQPSLLNKIVDVLLDTPRKRRPS
jgi:hypothetical protein